MDGLKKIADSIKNLPKVLLDLIKLIPLLIKGVVFLVTTVPLKIIKLLKTIGKFMSRAKSILFAVLISFLGIFFSIQYLFKYLTGLGTAIPHIPLALFSLFIVFNLVMNDSSQLKQMQVYLFRGFIFIFDNPIIKDILKFNVKIDKNNPKKANNDVLKWIGKNIPQVVFTLFAVAIISKIFIKKVISYAK